MSSVLVVEETPAQEPGSRFVLLFQLVQSIEEKLVGRQVLAERAGAIGHRCPALSYQ
jgi:hypothetical protein